MEYGVVQEAMKEFILNRQVDGDITHASLQNQRTGDVLIKNHEMRKKY